MAHRWHQDIKPANVLCNLNENLSDYQCVYKLADLGLSHVILDQSRNARVIDSRGTRTYGAPETYRPDDVTESRERYVTQKVDVWSLGCILAEHAVWITQGKDGLEEFGRRRIEATKDLGIRDTGCFHNGSHVLHVVSEKMEEVKDRTQKGDQITGKVIDDLICEMLWQEAKRTMSESLWTKASLVIHVARRDLERYKGVVQSEANGSSIRPSEPPAPDRVPSHPDHGCVVTPSTASSDISSSSSSSASPPSPRTNVPSKTDRAAPANESPEGLTRAPEITSPAERNPQTRQSHDKSVSSNTLQRVDTGSSRSGSVFPMVLQNAFDVRAVEQAIQSGANVDEKNQDGQTLIMLAAEEGKFDVVEFLQDKVQLGLKDKRNQSLLHYLLNVSDGTSRMDEVLYHARSTGRPLDVDAADSQGWTLLHEAARTEKCKAIQVLVNHGANINSRDQSDLSPAQVALKENKVDVLKLFLKENCDLLVQKDDLEGRHPAIRSLLEEYNKLPEGIGLCHGLLDRIRS
ncbi:MAG: hypothetical protein Q9157_003098 [Trypethelium eluteriae]